MFGLSDLKPYLKLVLKMNFNFILYHGLAIYREITFFNVTSVAENTVSVSHTSNQAKPQTLIQCRTQPRKQHNAILPSINIMVSSWLSSLVQQTSKQTISIFHWSWQPSVCYCCPARSLRCRGLASHILLLSGSTTASVSLASSPTTTGPALTMLQRW